MADFNKSMLGLEVNDMIVGSFKAGVLGSSDVSMTSLLSPGLLPTTVTVFFKLPLSNIACVIVYEVV